MGLTKETLRNSGKTMIYEIQHYFTPFGDEFSDFNLQIYDWFLNPVLTPTAVKAIRDSYQLDKNVTTYNAVFDRIYKATLDFLTVNIAGRHTGRKFLLALQHEMSGKTPLDYNNKILYKILCDLHFDSHDFIKNRYFAKKSLMRSQRNFHSDNLTTLPTSLIYYENEALRIDQLAQNQLFSYLHHIENNKTAEN
ncbi:hypothetical protein Hs30E_13390 [Lactococcus hodotermopsidis]|uniref:Uncharacterized protein n=1 Tax=Pseudolactococcus hodotermopsidis TaxID=2709157 RepID=A0A6A0BEN3_9LACT|nr:DsbA family protein [Lactococcus hodotermopsidis]GFH42788.1 hypothetical protein Hs30E_13390 [Lactococcus hodotermopsidis]